MNAFLTSRGRRVLPLLAIGCLLVSLPTGVRADLLTSRLTDHAALTSNDSSAPGLFVSVVYESQGKTASQERDTEPNPRGAMTAAALIFVVPAGTMPTMPVIAETHRRRLHRRLLHRPAASTAPPPPPTRPNGPPTNNNPEPGSLVLALTGSGTAWLIWLRRRRKGCNSPVETGHSPSRKLSHGK